MSGTTDQTFIEAWRERQLRNEQAAARWREARLVEAGRAARRLTSLGGVKKILLIGSLARGTAHPGSDVDLWVEGLAESEWLTAVAMVREEIHEAEVDVIRAEWAGKDMAARAAAEGVVLDER